MSRAPRFLDHKQFRALLRAAIERKTKTSDRDRFLLVFLGRTGLRVSEALALSVCALYLNNAPPFVRVRTLKQRGGKHSIDDVYLDRRAVRAIRSWLNSGFERFVGRAHRPQDALIPATRLSRSGNPKPMSRRNALRIFRLYASRADLPATLTLHSLRHYRGTCLYQATQDLDFTREQLRHQYLSSTQQYLHRSPERVQRYLEQLATTAND